MNERDVFAQAIEIDDHRRRREFLAQACGEDESLQQRVESLLDVHGRAGSFLERPAIDPQQTTCFEPLAEKPGMVIGRYKLLEQIGEGGMGVVFMAEQLEPVRRKVALKIVKPGMDSHQVISRFEAERQALALMDHPNIARVLDGGSTGERNPKSEARNPKQTQSTKSENQNESAPGESVVSDIRASDLEIVSDFGFRHSDFSSGRPYFVMELVRGIPITEYCDHYHVTLRQRLELFVQVCHAVQHAHQKGIIHRDIKPSNVMVTLHDGTPVPKVIDFGVAKAIGQELTERTLFTNFAQLIGTPLYMSPEQAALSGVDVDTRSDVYSLGVLLYEMLTGRTPFEGDRLREAGYDEMRRIIREEEPPRPSVRVTTLKAACTTDCPHCHGQPRDLVRNLRGELDWIVMKCLEKDRTRRYESASALAADVRRYLSDEPVEAGPPSIAYRARKFARRHSAALATAAATALALLVATGFSLWQAAEAKRARALAVEERQDAEQNLELAREATDKLLRYLEEEALPPSPRFDGVRRALLKEVEEFYRRLLAQKGDTPAVRFSMARAWRRIGEVKYELEDFDAAIAAYEKSFAALEELIARHPADPKYIKELAEGNQALASSKVHSGGGNLRADKYLTRAIDLRQALAKLEPDQPDHRFEIMVQQARLERVQGRSGNEAWLRRQVESARAFAAQHPKNVNYRDHVIEMLDLLAAFRPHHGGQKEEIIKLLDEIVKLTEDRLREGGIERHYRVYLATKLEGKADFLQRHGEHAEAEKLFRQALTHYDDLFRRLKLGHNHEAVRALCRIRLGERFEEQKRLAEAEQVYRVALDDLAHGAWGQRWNALTHLISVLIRQKRPDAAASRLAQHIASAREEAQAAPAQLGLTLELVAAELMRAESAGEASVSVRGALARLELPAWSDPKATAEHLSNYAWQMARPAGSPLPRTAVALAEEAARLAPDLFDMHRLLGIARYRARDYAGAAASLKRSLELKPNENITGSLFLAMALRHQGNAAEARKWHEKAAAWIAGQKSVPEQLKELEKEAKALLGLDGPPPAVKRTPTE